jgi:two-component system, LytTR family, response regulator LytT
MRVLIIEDEAYVAKNLIRKLKSLNEDIEVLAVLDSIEASLDWLDSHSLPDLIFSDIQLSDGLSFEIYQNFKINCPIIFTTAFDQYTLQAFQTNSISYLVKPVSIEALKQSLEKYELLTQTGANKQQSQNLDALLALLGKSEEKKHYKQRFLVKIGEKSFPIATPGIAYFFLDEITFLVTAENKKYPVEFSLNQLEEILDPKEFFRANRQFIVNIQQVQKITSHHTGKLLVTLALPLAQELVISRDKANAFKAWMDA